MGDINPKVILSYIADALAERKIAGAFVCEIEAEDSLVGEVKRQFGGLVIANELSPKKTESASSRLGMPKLRH